MTRKQIRSEVPNGVRIISADGEVVTDNLPVGFEVANLEHDDRISYDEQLQADEHAGWLEQHDPRRSPYVVKVGAKCATLSEAKAVRRHWSNAMYNGKLEVVTLDTDPEVKGRPMQYRPYTDAVVAVDCQGWGPGDANVAIVYCVPARSWLADDPQPNDPGHRTELASLDGASVTHVIAWERWSIQQVESWGQAGRDAVRAVAGRALPQRNDADDERERTAAGAAALRRLATM
jgi:hypothetical protein